jgi:hypothetical protein
MRFSSPARSTDFSQDAVVAADQQHIIGQVRLETPGHFLLSVRGQ